MASEQYRCRLCGAHKEHVLALVTVRGLTLCDECIELYRDICALLLHRQQRHPGVTLPTADDRPCMPTIANSPSGYRVGKAAEVSAVANFLLGSQLHVQPIVAIYAVRSDQPEAHESEDPDG